MGLDAVEIIFRAEEFYSVVLLDEETARVRTVYDFYGLLCAKLNVAPLDHPQTPLELPVVSASERGFWRKRVSLPPPAEVLPWTAHSVWSTLVALLVDQQGLRPEEILPAARFVEDLGVD